jgi:hypothetical protein
MKLSAEIIWSYRTNEGGNVTEKCLALVTTGKKKKKEEEKGEESVNKSIRKSKVWKMKTG